MMEKFIIRACGYCSIVKILFAHLKQKWKDESSDFVLFGVMIALGVVLSCISTILYGHPNNFIETTLLYIGVVFLAISTISWQHEKLLFHRIVYEIKYVGRMLTFMIQCYRNLISSYREFIKEIRTTDDKMFDIHDTIVISTIFKKLFTMYFETIDLKRKNPEPYLIDVQEMADIYVSKEFNNFYSALFFNMKGKEGKSSYEQVIIKLLDEVMSQLYTKSWFVDNYNEQIMTKIIKYILNNWYNYIAEFEASRSMSECLQ